MSAGLGGVRQPEQNGRGDGVTWILGGIMALSTSYWPADDSEPVVDLTVGDALRDAAAEAPHAIALVEGAADPAARRRWSTERERLR